MAAIDFPNAPTTGQLFVASNGVIYQWTGVLWTVYGTVAPATFAAPPTYDYNNTLIADAGTGGAGGDVAMTITQGQAIFTRSYTANNPANPIEVDLTAMIGMAGTANWGVLALFLDGAVNAVAQMDGAINASWGVPFRVYWQGVLAAGAHTFHARFGSISGATGYLNGYGSGRLGGGAVRTTMVVREIGQGIIGAQGPQGPIGPTGPAGGSGNWQTGDVIETYRANPDVGWILMNDGTIGNAGSGATTRANADTQPLFNMFWPFAGCTIAGGKGASAAADWAALKAISLPLRRGRSSLGAGQGTSLTLRNPADSGGAESVGSSDVNVGLSFMGPPGGPAAYVGSHGHNVAIMQPFSAVYFHLKL